MGILDTIGEIAGAVVAVEAADKIDPDASLLTKGIAAIAGFKGAGAVESLLDKQEEQASKTETGDSADSLDNADPQA